jgi:hypothetical protein
MPAMTERTPDARLAWLSSVITALLLLNVLAWGLGAHGLVPVALLCLIVLCLAAFLMAPDIRHWPLRCFLAALIVIALGSPTDGWDARSIWLFHGKRIYLDADLLAQFDNYAAWSHNDYPVLAPALAASIASLIGGWNEIAPKLSALLVMSPALLLAGAILQARDAQLLLCLLLLVFGRTHLVDGYMDVVLAAHLGAAVLGMVVLVRRAGKPESRIDPSLAMAVGLAVAMMPLIKNEGLAAAVLALGVVGVLLIWKFRIGWTWKLPLALLVFSVPTVAWRAAVAMSGIGNDLADGNWPSRLLERLQDLGSHMLILDAMWKEALTAALLLIAAWYLWREKRLAAIGTGVCAAYLALLYLVYLSTPFDLQWHLSTSAGRVTLPPVVLAGVLLCLALDVWTRREAATTLASGRSHASFR